MATLCRDGRHSAIGGGIVGGVLNALKPSSKDGKVILPASVLSVLLIGIVALFLL